MKKNGFTLAELLGVIVILSLISVITIPAVTSSLNTYKERLCNSQLDQIISATRAWATDNIVKLPTENGKSYQVSLRELTQYGYIDDDIKNPISKTDFDLDSTIITITRVNKTYSYQIDAQTVKSCKK
jgi:prepilin-type N-terminal cleavage/methylation domain-containing protein